MSCWFLMLGLLHACYLICTCRQIQHGTSRTKCRLAERIQTSIKDQVSSDHPEVIENTSQYTPNWSCKFSVPDTSSCKMQHCLYHIELHTQVLVRIFSGDSLSFWRYQGRQFHSLIITMMFLLDFTINQ